MTGKRQGQQFCLFCVSLQLLVLFGLAAQYYNPKENSFILELDWRQFHQQDEACKWLGNFGAGVAYPGFPGNPEDQALLLRGAASHWPALSKMSFPYLQYHTTPTKYPGTTIISPTPTFKVFNNNTELIEASADPLKAPSLPCRLELMPMKEFFKRRDHSQPPMFYPQGEFYYHQAPVPREVMEGLGLHSRPISCLNSTLAGMSIHNLPKGFKGNYTSGKMLDVTGALIRLTDADTTHIAHYDATATIMLQMSGIKDVQLLPPSKLNAIYPYERGHLLYRRAQVNITHPDVEKYPLAKDLNPTKIRLYAGDFLVFPGYVPHQPEAVTDSISISFRIRTVQIKPPQSNRRRLYSHK